MEITDRYLILAKSPLFHSLEPPQIKKVLAGVSHRFIKFQRKVIAVRGEVCNRLMILLTGRIRGEMVDHRGKVLRVETLTPPSLLAPAFIFARDNYFPVDLIADPPINLLAIPRPALATLLSRHPVIMENFLGILSNKTRFLSERLYKMSFNNIQEKIGHYLWVLYRESQSPRIRLPQSITTLSEYFGVSRPSLSRVIGEMEKQGIIRHSKREITILDPMRLQSLSEQP
jgi:CRP-like cAMP-binding protein